MVHVIVTDNMFGDIITDLGAMIQGGMGIAAGGNINLRASQCLSQSGLCSKIYRQNVVNPLANLCGE